MSYADYLSNLVEARGLEHAFQKACDHIRQEELRQNSLWTSRFFELRTLDGGGKKLVPTTERDVSSAVDLADGHEVSPIFWQDDEGALHPVTFGRPAWTTSEDERTAWGDGTMVANGKHVGNVHYTDH